MREVRRDSPKKVSLEPKSASRNEVGEVKTSKSREQHVQSPDGQRRHDQLKAFRQDCYAWAERERTRYMMRTEETGGLCCNVKGFVFILTV